jgi:hypothetical protein
MQYKLTSTVIEAGKMQTTEIATGRNRRELLKTARQLVAADHGKHCEVTSDRQDWYIDWSTELNRVEVVEM